MMGIKLSKWRTHVLIYSIAIWIYTVNTFLKEILAVFLSHHILRFLINNSIYDEEAIAGYRDETDT